MKRARPRSRPLIEPKRVAFEGQRPNILMRVDLSDGDRSVTWKRHGVGFGPKDWRITETGPDFADEASMRAYLAGILRGWAADLERLPLKKADA